MNLGMRTAPILLVNAGGMPPEEAPVTAIPAAAAGKCRQDRKNERGVVTENLAAKKAVGKVERQVQARGGKYVT